MTRMLQALRQIESRTKFRRRGVGGRVAGRQRRHVLAETVESPPPMGDAMGSSQQLWQQVEAALAAESADALPICRPPLPLPAGYGGSRPVPPPSPSAGPHRPTDPYGGWRMPVLAEFSPVDAAC